MTQATPKNRKMTSGIDLRLERGEFESKNSLNSVGLNFTCVSNFAHKNSIFWIYARIQEA